MNYARTHYGNKAPTRLSLKTSLLTVLTMRDKPLSEREIASLARSHGTTEDKVREMAARCGCGG